MSVNRFVLLPPIELKKFSSVNFLLSEDIKNLLQTKILLLNNGKVLINKKFFNMHDYIVHKIIDNF